MNPKLFERVTKLFDAVRQLPPAERTAHLDSGSGGDEELRSEVESLLAHHDAASGLLSESALADPVPSEPQREGLVAKIAVE